MRARPAGAAEPPARTPQVLGNIRGAVIGFTLVIARGKGGNLPLPEVCGVTARIGLSDDGPGGGMATIHEVAALAGVSPATVSRVYNGTPVSHEKAALVRDAAARLEFVPNRTARTLRRQNSEVIGLVLPDIENPYFTSLARGVTDVAQRAGYSVVLCNTDEDADKEAQYLQVALSESMAGVILAPVSEHPDLGALLDRGRSVVTVDRSTSYALDAVLFANRPSGRAAAEALLRGGYQRIACITGPRDIETATERAAGWRCVLADHGFGDSWDDYLRYSTFRVDGGRDAMTDLLSMERPPDAVVAANNLMGVGALQVLSEHDLLPPVVGVAVIGDLPFTTLTPQAVTMVRMPARQLGTTSAELLLDRINGDQQQPRTIVLESSVEHATTNRNGTATQSGRQC